MLAAQDTEHQEWKDGWHLSQVTFTAAPAVSQPPSQWLRRGAELVGFEGVPLLQRTPAVPKGLGGRGVGEEEGPSESVMTGLAAVRGVPPPSPWGRPLSY